MKSVAIIIPCFNSGEYLSEALESTRNQTYTASEIVVVNDGSTDEHTLEILTKYAAEGITVYHTENRGASAARNYGIERTSSEYILCLDADDVLEPDFLAETVPRLSERPEVGVVATQVQYFGAAQGIWHTRHQPPTTLLWQNCMCNGSLFRRVCWEEAGGYKDLKGCQDWDLWISIVVERGWKWEVVEKPLYRYRKGHKSISEYRESNRAEILKQMIEMHAATYTSHCADIVIEMDAELTRLKQRLKKYEHSTNGHGAFGVSDYDLSNDQKVIERIRKIVKSRVPEQSVVAVGWSHDELPELEGVQLRHFPQEPGEASERSRPANSAEVISLLEEARDQGTEFLLFPKQSMWWLTEYDEFRQYVEQHYRVVARDNSCVIFDTRAEILKHTFSVVICTYKRASLLKQSIESVFNQNYPKDKYELVIVNNDSPDNTEAIATECAQRSPVPYSYLVEKRNGLSFARNTGIEKAQFEFVAFLDDDAIACENWLAAFNAVINEHHALVIGGRIEKAFEGDFVPPDWFNFQYIKHFFGVNYRDRGKLEKVFRIRFPLYLTGACIAYAKRLFDHFGGFDPRLGRDGKSLLAGEETYLNLILDKNDIPMYYTDDGYVHHYIESYRLTKSHLRKKAYWSGITAAIMNPRFFGHAEVLRRSRKNWSEMWRLLFQIVKQPRNPANFSRVCRVIYNLAFLYKFGLVFLKYQFTKEAHPLPEVTWTENHWINEVKNWPEGEEKYRQLYDLYVSLGNSERAEAALAKLIEHSPSGLAADSERPLDDYWAPLRRLKYNQLIGRCRNLIETTLPHDARMLIISKGDEELIKLGRKLSHFPQTEDGEYAGCYPANSADAISHLETLRRKGSDFLLIPSTSMWWLEHYAEFGKHLETQYRVVASHEDTGVIFALRNSPDARLNQKARSQVLSVMQTSTASR